MGVPFGTSYKAFSIPCKNSFKKKDITAREIVNEGITDEEIIGEINKELSKKELFIEWLLRENLISPELLSRWLLMKENRTEDTVKVKGHSKYKNTYVPLKELRRVNNLMHANSLDAPAFPDSTETLVDLLVDPNASTPEDNLEEEGRWSKGWIIDAFNDVLETYPPTTDINQLKQIFYERVIATEPKTLQELANRYGIHRYAIDSKEKKLLRRLRNRILDKYGHHLRE